MRGFAISEFTLEDSEHIQRSAEFLGPLLPGVLDALYDHLLSLPETREFFNGQDVQHRKQSLVTWAARTIQEPADDDLWTYLARVGKIHRDYGIPSYQIVHLMAWVQDVIVSALLTSTRSGKEAEAIAWMKMLTAQLDPLLRPYATGEEHAPSRAQVAY